MLAGARQGRGGRRGAARPQAGRPRRRRTCRSWSPKPEPYVSRGGHKLAAALDAFGIDPAGLVASMSVPRPVASRTSCCSAVRRVSTPSTSGRGQLAEPLRARPAGRVDGTDERPEPDRDDHFPEPDPPRHRRRLVHLPRDGARPDRLHAPAEPRAATSSRWSSRSSRSAAGGTDHGVVRDPADPPRGPRAGRRGRRAEHRAGHARASSPRRSTGPEGNREFLVDLAPGARLRRDRRADRRGRSAEAR